MIIIEAKKDKRFGHVGTLLVLSGKLEIGDTFICGLTYGRVRMMMTDKGDRIKEAVPATPVELVSFNDLPEPGDALVVVKNEKVAKSMVQERKDKLRMVSSAPGDSGKQVTLEDLFSSVEAEEVKTLNLIVKCESVGSLEAVVSSLESITSDKIKLNIIHKGIGPVTDNDVMLARASSDTIVIAFKVTLMSGVEESASRAKIQIRKYEIR